MRIERTVSANINDPIIEQCITEYLLQVGYQRVADDSTLVFQRGTRWSTWLSFTPKNWNSKVTLERIPNSKSKTILQLEVNTTGQLLVTRKEIAFFKAEFNALESVLRGTEFPAITVAETEQSAFRQNIVGTSFLILLILVSIVIFQIGAILMFRSLLSAVIGTLTGAAFSALVAFCLRLKFNKEPRQPKK